MKHLKILIFMILILSSASNGWCGWWIFGQSQDEVVTSYLYLNGTSFDEISEKATIYRNTLDNGQVTIKGKASAGKNRIAKVEITLDGNGVWQDVPQENGVFNYRFTPALDKPFEFYLRVTDTRGRTNNVSASHRTFTVSDQNIRGMVIGQLNNLVRAYQTKNSTEFMSYVSPEFVADAVNLDRAIRRDFSSFDNIAITFTINNITSSGGKVAVSITYNRSLTSIRSGATLRDNGMTEFILKQENNRLSIFSMKNPLIFGVSDPGEVATGSAANSPGTLVITVDSQGNVATIPFKDLNSAISGSVTAHW